MDTETFNRKLAHIIGSGISRRQAENNWGMFPKAQREAMLALFAEAGAK